MRERLKRGLCLALAAMMTFSLAACGGKGESKNDAKGEYQYVATFKTFEPNAGEDTTSAYEVNGNKMIYTHFGVDKAKRKLESAKISTMDIETGEVTKTVNIEDMKIFGEDGSFDSIHEMPDGTYRGIVTYYDKKTYDAICSVAKIDADGNVLELKPFTEIFDIPVTYVYKAYYDKDDNMIINTYSEVLVANKDLEQIAKFENLNWIEDVILLADGSAYLVYYDMQLSSGVVRKADFKSNSLGESFSVAESTVAAFAGNDNKIYVATGANLLKYDTQTHESENLFGWLDVDMVAEGFAGFEPNEDGSFDIVTSSYDDDGNLSFEKAHVYKEKVSEANKKQEIVMCGMNMVDASISKGIRDFNRSNDKYKVVFKSYVDEYEDYEVAYERFEQDLIAGTAGDIFDCYGTDYKKYTGKNALEDILPYMEKDPDFNRNDYFANIFDACTENGKLYVVSPTVFVSSLTMDSKYLSGNKELTMAKMLEIRKQYPDIAFLPAMTQENMLMYSLVFAAKDFIDFDAAKCSFDSQEFYDLLEFAKSFPKEIDEENYNAYSGFADGQNVGVHTQISSISDYQIMNQLMEGRAVLTGYPHEKGTGVSFIALQQLCISNKSKNKEGAWEVLKYYLSEAYQDKAVYGLPVLKSSFDKKAKEAMTPEMYEDETGKMVEDVKVSFYADDMQFEVYAASQTDVDEVTSIMERVDSLYFYNEDIINIVTEEAGAYLSGDKTAEEVGQLIQNRVSIYLAENR